MFDNDESAARSAVNTVLVILSPAIPVFTLAAYQVAQHAGPECLRPATTALVIGAGLASLAYTTQPFWR